DRAGLERGHDLALDAFGEIRGVDQGEGERREQLLALAARGRGLHDRRRVPLAEQHRIAVAFEPLREQRELRALARAVDALDDEEPPGQAPYVRAVGLGRIHDAAFLRRTWPSRRGGP